MKIMETLKTCKMSKITIKALVTGTIKKYIDNRSNICKDFSDSKIQKIKNSLYQMVIECSELCMPLYNKEKYIEITDIIIPDIIGSYNEILPIKVHIDAEKTQKIIEKIKLSSNGGESSKGH